MLINPLITTYLKVRPFMARNEKEQLRGAKIDVDSVKALYAAGQRIGAIAKREGLSYMGVREVLIRSGALTTRSRKPIE
jgi:hypothetical protein